MAPSPTPIADISWDLGLLIARTRRATLTAASRRLDLEGESVHAWRTLGCLIYEGKTSQSDLADITAQHPAGLSRLLDELEAQKLVRRRRDTKDRRKLWVEVTARGRERHAAANPAVLEALREVFLPLTGADRRRLRGLLEKLLGTLSA